MYILSYVFGREADAGGRGKAGLDEKTRILVRTQLLVPKQKSAQQAQTSNATCVKPLEQHKFSCV